MTKLYLFIILWISASCQTHNGKAENEEIRVLNDVFIEVVGSFARVLSHPPQVIHEPEEITVPDTALSERTTRTQEQNNNEKYEDYPDTISVIEVLDTLYVPDLRNRWPSILEDSTVWVESLNMKLNSSPEYLPVNRLNNIGSFQVKGIKEVDKESWVEDRKLVVQFSRVIFNKDHTKAFFLVDFYGRLGEIIFVEKKDGKWKMTESQTLWVS